jgi:nitrogen regulatory protein A
MEVGEMAKGDLALLEAMRLLLDLTSSDFIALAPFIDKAVPLRWKYALGNSNGRYQHMVIKTGQGLAGAALRLGRWVKLDGNHPRFDLQKSECPVMLAEQLRAAAVFPLIQAPNAGISGLLFIGRRTGNGYEEGEIRTIEKALGMLLSYLEEKNQAPAK